MLAVAYARNVLEYDKEEKYEVELPVGMHMRRMLQGIGFIFTDETHAMLPDGWKTQYVGEIKWLFVDQYERERGSFYISKSNGGRHAIVELYG